MQKSVCSLSTSQWLFLYFGHWSSLAVQWLADCRSVVSSGSSVGWVTARQTRQRSRAFLSVVLMQAGSLRSWVVFFAFLCLYFYLKISRTTTVIKSSILYVILNLDPFSTSNTLCFFFCFRAFMYPTCNIPLNHNPSLLFKLISASSPSACHFCPV